MVVGGAMALPRSDGAWLVTGLFHASGLEVLLRMTAAVAKRKHLEASFQADR